MVVTPLSPFLFGVAAALFMAFFLPPPLLIALSIDLTQLLMSSS